MKTIYGIENYENFAKENGIIKEISAYQIECFEKEKISYSSFLEFCKPIHAFIVYEHSDSDIKRHGYNCRYYCNNMYFVLEYKGLYLCPTGNRNDKTFGLRIDNCFRHSYLINFTLVSVDLDQAPAKIGKATEKKIRRMDRIFASN